MDRDTIIRLAREAGWNGIYSKPLMSISMQEEDFLRFAALVAAHEREACAQMLDDIEKHNWNVWDCAAAIRSRT